MWLRKRKRTGPVNSARSSTSQEQKPVMPVSLQNPRVSEMFCPYGHGIFMGCECLCEQEIKIIVDLVWKFSRMITGTVWHRCVGTFEQHGKKKKKMTLQSSGLNSLYFASTNNDHVCQLAILLSVLKYIVSAAARTSVWKKCPCCVSNHSDSLDFIYISKAHTF